MENLLENVKEFLESGEENLKKRRFNAAVSDFFKAIVILCDYYLYKEIKTLPKNHAERFFLLKTHFNSVYREISKLFNVYTLSYNQKLNKKDVLKLREYAYRLKARIEVK